MKFRGVLIGLLLACSPPVAGTTHGALRASVFDFPLLFEPNHDRMDSSVRFLARGPRYTLPVIKDAATNSPINVFSVASGSWQSELSFHSPTR